ncbi:GNAT family N-acetyltransferase [Photobacterium sp. TY1-4]|uniref:GNAT family N-acetyltransferase n=1 Tax=Photobacterium sp. TY1-4 TaxID=2899122 RepID=UPI0021BE3E30|nr:GNAT family N-acetyltransferase [Photobacterium sp. TY1-4]UXI02555.1 GNAT family N-acetyltransferase [Photobacterium sp. TY1-4]
MTFKRYETADRTQCINIFDSNLNTFFAPSERDEFIAFLDALDASSDYFVYTNGDRILACGGIEKHRNLGSLSWGMVHRDFHGQKLGTQLTDYRLSRLKADQTVTTITIETSQHTQGFYAKRGFVVTSQTKDGFGPGIDCVVMARQIAGDTVKSNAPATRASETQP